MTRSRHPGSGPSSSRPSDRNTDRSGDRSGGRPQQGASPRQDEGDEGARGGRKAARGGRGPAARGVLLYGLHPVAAALTNPERRIHRLLVTDSGRAALEPAIAAARAQGLQRPEASPADRMELDRMLPAGAVHQGVVVDASPLPDLGIEDVCNELAGETSAVIVALDQVTDPHNVGAILRSAAAFGARAVVVTERHAPETTGVLAKSASGALEAVPLIRVTNLARALTDLQQNGFWSVGLAESGQSTLAKLNLTGKTVLVMGAEGSGLRRLTMERCDAIARLPTGGPVGSLNVSNAAAVALYEVARLRE
ncbi:23S rRNA (guanosine(2251)-2'-O)-methyltransferase RlmB [Azospirillum melinis]|uniref:23S rRNA (Guanosine(2251)-2'-O)-methyltransferase RlmB n=1 Tax=Azospirillum melinis TaxID=328839 RepID=A0ABX2KP36_9PROT|nr:23S rRNA (guanosine(2251)-2'-O)-methyltransferase RlmB [Azospirillum melinis]MBP2308006.1 23S rRNA (guanosine2251-2'-O)-methyltransferase [Azospirillum melinis]NUB04362.1 23S rRNA (guanosine(2251)-2'-O)-methyltransferase RlmB [Azospirillum melinis]